MIAPNKKLRPPLKTHGGKAYLARRIIALMPPHWVYVEPFLGGGSVLLNKPRAEHEVAGDIGADLINFWQRLSNESVHIGIVISQLDYSSDVFERAKTIPQMTNHPIDRAIGFLVRNRFSRGGLGETFAWSDRLRGGQPGDVNAWDTIRAELPAIAERIRGVEFNCCDALHLIRSHDAADALIYCDPPYLHETRTVRDAYAHEMAADRHAEMLETLQPCQGTVMLSGYRSPLYDRTLAGWTRHEWNMPNHSGQGKSKERRTECLWIKGVS